MSLESEIAKMEKLIGATGDYGGQSPAEDPRKLLIERINQIAARAEVCGEMPEHSELNHEEAVRQTKEILQEYLRRKYDNNPD